VRALEHEGFASVADLIETQVDQQDLREVRCISPAAHHAW
jgi:hypothetical protein